MVEKSVLSGINVPAHLFETPFSLSKFYFFQGRIHTIITSIFHLVNATMHFGNTCHLLQSLFKYSKKDNFYSLVCSFYIWCSLFLLQLQSRPEHILQFIYLPKDFLISLYLMSIQKVLHKHWWTVNSVTDDLSATRSSNKVPPYHLSNCYFIYLMCARVV